jgi:hypothetical protein
MRRFWVIVRRDLPALFDALSSAYMRRREYVVIMDRRLSTERRRERAGAGERRYYRADVEPFAIVPVRQIRESSSLDE